MKTYRAGLIGYGKIGRHWARHFARDSRGRWELACICDIDPARLAAAADVLPGVATVLDADAVFGDDGIDAVCIATLSDAKPALIRAALATGKHLIVEKPIAADAAAEQELLGQIEASDRLVAVNLFNRNAWYHHEAQAFIAAGEIGKLGIVRVAHLTAGLMPGTAHLPEGPPFHDCGMHYVDLARWYAGSEYDQWHAQGVRMWSEAEPWFVTVHGTFRNGVAFEIANGFVYGQMARDTINNSSCELIGTKGVVRMRHDFKNCTLQMHGVGKTVERTAGYGGKNMDVMLDVFARSLDAGKDLGLPGARDAVIASLVSQEMQAAAAACSPPAIGTGEQMQEILRFKAGR